MQRKLEPRFLTLNCSFPNIYTTDLLHLYKIKFLILAYYLSIKQAIPPTSIQNISMEPSQTTNINLGFLYEYKRNY